MTVKEIYMELVIFDGSDTNTVVVVDVLSACVMNKTKLCTIW